MIQIPCGLWRFAEAWERRIMASFWQRDTYFVVPQGRLKLREQRPGAAHLIQYDRADQPHQRQNRYRITFVEDADAMRALLVADLRAAFAITDNLLVATGYADQLKRPG